MISIELSQLVTFEIFPVKGKDKDLVKKSMASVFGISFGPLIVFRFK